jgi:putative DNA primase/helicase
MREAGLNYSGPIERDGNRHRIVPDDHTEKTAWYRFYIDNPPAANFGDWRFHESDGINWSIQPTRQLTPDELEAQKKEIIRRRVEKHREDERRRAKAEKKASEVWSVSSANPRDAGYVLRKGIQPHVARQYQGETHWFENEPNGMFINHGDIVIPVVREGKIVGLQLIKETDGKKLFLSGTHKEGAYCHIGPKPEATLIICEGYATGASIFEATGLPVFVAFDCGNLLAVSKGLRERNPNARIIIAADDDRHRDDNPGLTKAANAASAIQAVLCRPIFKPGSGDKPTDFNDLASLEGLAEVAHQIINNKPSFAVAELVKQRHAEILEQDFKPIVIQLASEPPPTSELLSRYEALGLALTMNGHPICNTDNILRILQNFKAFEGFIWIDDFHMKMFTNWDGEVREWTEVDTIQLMVIFQREFGMRGAKRTHVQEAVEIVAKKNLKNEPRDWIKSLVWDKNSRIENFFADCMGAFDNDYTKAASKNFWVGLAARILLPGCKLDTMVIFEGGQGKLKSTALETIGGKWYTVSATNPTNKDFYLIMQGNILIEIAELDGFSRAEVNTIKNILSTRKDRFRPPYGRTALDFPRQSVFAGSTNEDEYLRDSTGGRRFWPIKVGNVDIQLIKEHRDQLFAEAAVRFREGFTWWEMPAETKLEQEARRQTDPWEEPIENYIRLRDNTGVTAHQVASDCLKIPDGQITHAHALRIGKILRLCGWVRSTGSDKKTKLFKPPST